MISLRLGAGALLLLSAVVWRAGIAEQWTRRIPSGWSFTAEYVGVLTNADPESGTLPERDAMGAYERAMRIVPDTGRAPGVLLEDRYTIRDARSGKAIFQYVTHDRVDPSSGARLEPEYAGDIALFPRNVEKRTYRLRTSYIKGIPLTFEREDEVDGMRTYLFSYLGRGEYTESYLGTAEIPGVKVLPGQEISCADEQFYYRVWVEPRTGSMVKLEEGCPCGDFVVDRATGRRVAAVDRWSGGTAGNALLARAADVRRDRLVYLVSAWYLPLALTVAGVLLVLTSVRMPRTLEAS